MWLLLVLLIFICFLLSPPLLTSMKLIKSKNIKIFLTVFWVMLLILVFLLAYSISIKSHYNSSFNEAIKTNSENILYIIIFSAGLIYVSPWSIKRQIKKEIPKRFNIVFWIVRICFILAILSFTIDCFLG